MSRNRREIGINRILNTLDGLSDDEISILSDADSEFDFGSEALVSDSEEDPSSNRNGAEEIPGTSSTRRSNKKAKYTETWKKIENVEDSNGVILDEIPDFIGEHRVLGMDGLQPVQCFYKFFPESIFIHVANETNKYADTILCSTVDVSPRSRYWQWEEVDEQDIRAIVALEIGMGMCKKPSLDSYFGSSFWLTRTPGFCEIMTRDKYILLRAFLHFNDNGEQVAKGQDGYDAVFKVRPILDYVQDTYATVYQPNKELSIDETMLKFKGRLSFKQYMPNKPSSKWGVKLWSICDAHTGFLLKFQIYTGKDASAPADTGLGARVVKALLENYQNMGHVAYMDNFYSGPELFRDLKAMGIGACGTVRVNRIGMPEEMKKMKIKMKRFTLPIMWITEDSSMMACTWRDTGRVNMLSTVGKVGVTEVDVNQKAGKRKAKKPNIQIMYNKYMGGVDRFDHYCSSYPFDHRVRRWYQVIWHFLIEVALVNACIAYNCCNPGKKLSHRRFRECVISGLLENYTKWRSVEQIKPRKSSAILNKARLTDRHFIAQYDDKKMKPDCVVCSIRPKACSKKGKGVCRRKQTTYFCKNCPNKPALCVIDCFESYHTKARPWHTCKCATFV